LEFIVYVPAGYAGVLFLFRWREGGGLVSVKKGDIDSYEPASYAEYDVGSFFCCDGVTTCKVEPQICFVLCPQVAFVDVRCSHEEVLLSRLCRRCFFDVAIHFLDDESLPSVAVVLAAYVAPDSCERLVCFSECHLSTPVVEVINKATSRRPVSGPADGFLPVVLLARLALELP